MFTVSSAGNSHLGRLPGLRPGAGRKPAVSCDGDSPCYLLRCGARLFTFLALLRYDPISRTMHPGRAIRGYRLNGLLSVEQAVEKGAVSLV